jgi:hypothetical protein
MRDADEAQRMTELGLKSVRSTHFRRDECMCASASARSRLVL